MPVRETNSEKNRFNLRSGSVTESQSGYKRRSKDGKIKKVHKNSSERVNNTQPEFSNGNERANHKYIRKVKTKSGKVRYIYDEKKGDSNLSDREKLARAKRKGIERKDREAKERYRKAKYLNQQQEQGKAREKAYAKEQQQKEQRNRYLKSQNEQGRAREKAYAKQKREQKAAQNRYLKSLNETSKGYEKRYMREKYGNSLPKLVVGKGIETAKSVARNVTSTIESASDKALSSIKRGYNNITKNGSNWLRNVLNI